MSEPWNALPPAIARDVAERWPSVFPDGVPGWLGRGSGMGETVVADALGRSLFLCQVLERHPQGQDYRRPVRTDPHPRSGYHQSVWAPQR